MSDDGGAAGPQQQLGRRVRTPTLSGFVSRFRTKGTPTAPAGGGDGSRAFWWNEEAGADVRSSKSAQILKDWILKSVKKDGVSPTNKPQEPLPQER